ncbi:cytidine deaminase [Clostridium formicaceticum]|uniref:Cytidine deaminase n=1 Tax=Clostridium formicaceticum TaxID=1497 RepID=A0AAC9RM58_9CLOT|nr:cytidine deaminase [Clostridium formicaceticum]AOY77551.1 cytidine deaminase [Clostridium formicaceticum]ARE88127.1 Cytidine deaminase [Clostridium formicaceticum]
MEYKELIKEAREAQKKAYVPYSHFPVGAAVLTKSGKVYRGCNIECASYGGTNCAERTAIFKAVSEGDREIEAIAVVGATDEYTFPCGICRQVIVEYGKDIKIIIGKTEEDYKVFTIADLLPNSFSPEDLSI